MTKYILMLCLVLGGCATSIHQLSTKCKTPPEQLFSQLTIIGLQNGLNVKMNDSKSGILQLESAHKAVLLTNMQEVRSWAIQYDGDTVRCFAKQSLTNYNVFGNPISSAETYYDDKVSRDLGWYWKIRERLEKTCGNVIIFTSTEPN